MKSFLPITLFATLIYLLFPLKSYADTSCQPIYGGGQSCIATSNILINKTVLNPQTNKMVDNLSINDPKYQPNFITTFQIKVTNTGDHDFSSVQIKDIFPQYLLFSAGPGTFDENTKTLTFSVDNLKPQESRIFTIMGRVADEKSILFTNGDVCVVNQAYATTNTNETTQDHSRLCIEKKVLGVIKEGFPVFPAPFVSQTPPTGPESLVLFSLIPTGLIGFLLRKRSDKNIKDLKTEKNV